MQQLLSRPRLPRAWAPATSRRGLHVSASAVNTIKQTIEGNKVVVYSATYCPYCSQAKSLFENLSVPAEVVECNVVPGGDQLRAGLTELTGRTTVPQVFIGGKHVGGCDDTMAAFSSGELKQMLAGVGIQI